MNYIDITLITLIALITVRGLFRGLITELMVLVAIVLGFVAATSLHSYLQKYILNIFPDLSSAIAKIIAFVVIFIAVNIIVRLISMTLNKIATFTFLQPVNKITGAVFAFVKITLLLSIILIVVDIVPGSDFMMKKIGKDESISYQPIKKFAPFIWDSFADPEHLFKNIIPFDDISEESTNAIIKNLK